MKKFLIIQTAFTGDVILATSVAEKLYSAYPDAVIHFLLRKGNEGLLQNHPFISKVLVWDKKQGKYAHLFSLLKQIRAEGYDEVVNLHRFASSGFLTAFSKAKHTTGFDKNPFSFLFSKKVIHKLDGRHEVERNIELINHLVDNTITNPVLYPEAADFEVVKGYVGPIKPYVVFAPASVWYTKQLPVDQWVKLALQQVLPTRVLYAGGPGLSKFDIVFIGGTADSALCNSIIEQIAKQAQEANLLNLAGKLSYLQSAALIKGAIMTYVNDSAPLHMASAMNAPVTAFFCSTIPAFGFYPLSDYTKIIEKRQPLDCRPCGLHGFSECPKGHFDCAHDIDVNEAIIWDAIS